MRIFLKECTSLAAAGYEVHLVINATPEDVEIAAQHKVILHPLSKIPKARFRRMLLRTWACFRIARQLNADIYHFHDPELIPFGVWLSLAGKSVIYDVHEDLPRDIETKQWIPKWARSLVAAVAGCVENLAAKWAFSIVAATPHIATRFKAFNSGAIAINNYPLRDELAPTSTSMIRRRQICYIGGISRIRGIYQLVEALPRVPDIRLVMCGEITDPEFAEELASLPGWRQVDYRGQVGRLVLKEVMSESVAGIVTFLPFRNHFDAQPNKLFEYMSSGLPIIASDFALWREIVVGTNAGLCVDPESPAMIAAAIRQLVDDPGLVERLGKAGREAVLTRYNWSHEAEKLVQLYRGLA